MSIPAFQPKCSVILKKNIGRSNISGGLAASERFKGTAREIDLTPYLGDTGSVITDKGVREGMGAFSITLADRAYPQEIESLYGIIEPMDVIEIRMAHDTSLYAGSLPQHMPIGMRGFVTTIHRAEVMQPNGRPTRVVRITGHDYGKILNIMQIAYLPNEVTGQRLLAYFKLFVNYGLGSDPDQDASLFIAGILNNVITPFLNDMRRSATASDTAQNLTPVLNIGLDASVRGGLISPFGTNSWPGGTIDSMLRYFGDVGPWNELFIEDREDGPYLVYRPNPFTDPEGNYLQDPYISDASSRPPTVIVLDNDLVGLECERTDSGVANYYWVDGPRYQLIDGKLLQVGAAHAATPDQFYLSDYPNSSPFLYGFRRMEVQTQQGGRFDGQTAAVMAQRQPSTLAFVSDRRAVLIAQNKDNVVFETGNMNLRGNEVIKAGSIVRLVRGSAAGNGLVADYYAHHVRQTYLPFRSFTTSVTFDRGKGFISRLTRESGTSSPYLAETSQTGVYS